jgi:lipopolysaccharide transport system ATP-binding protein
MNETVIKVENLSKLYRLGELHKRTDSFREKLTNSFHHMLRSIRKGFKLMPQDSTPGNAMRQNAMPEAPDQIYALRDVSFQVKRGEVLGIIGRNGAGKSTLLKILSRITKPTEGTAWIEGRVGSLLEVGTGFHQELTGRENIYLNGAILGMTKVEIKRKFDEIVNFAEIEKFIDTPVKRYSSGMYVRLAFAVAAHLEPEILLVDEVLAVGDVQFQKKCIGKMGNISKKGRTVLFVSHNMAAIASLCTKCILLENGRFVDISDSESVITKYLNRVLGKSCDTDLRNHPGKIVNKYSVAHRFLIKNSKGDILQRIPIGSTAKFEIYLESDRRWSNISIGIHIYNSYGQRVVTYNSKFQHPDNIILEGSAVVSCIMPRLILLPGRYSLILSVASGRMELERIENVIFFEVTPRDIYGTGKMHGPKDGVFAPDGYWKVERL